MAKVTGPLYSISASGSIGNSFTFGIWKGIQYVRTWFKPANPKTAAQLIVRDRIRKAVAKYKTEGQPLKDFWNVEAQGLEMSGFNLYVKRYTEFMRDNAETEPAGTGVNPMVLV